MNGYGEISDGSGGAGSRANRPRPIRPRENVALIAVLAITGFALGGLRWSAAAWRGNGLDDNDEYHRRLLGPRQYGCNGTPRLLLLQALARRAELSGPHQQRRNPEGNCTAAWGQSVPGPGGPKVTALVRFQLRGR